MHAGTCLDTWFPWLLWRLLWCFGRLVVLIVPLASMLRVHWYFKKLFFNSLTIRISYKALIWCFERLSSTAFHVLVHRPNKLSPSNWMFLPRVDSQSHLNAQGQGFLFINKILYFWVSSRKSVSGILHSRSWRGKIHLSAQPKPQEAGIFKVLSIKHKPFASALQSEWGKDFFLSGDQLGFKLGKTTAASEEELVLSFDDSWVI